MSWNRSVFDTLTRKVTSVDDKLSTIHGELSDLWAEEPTLTEVGALALLKECQEELKSVLLLVQPAPMTGQLEYGKIKSSGTSKNTLDPIEENVERNNPTPVESDTFLDILSNQIKDASHMTDSVEKNKHCCCGNTGGCVFCVPGVKEQESDLEKILKWSEKRMRDYGR